MIENYEQIWIGRLLLLYVLINRRDLPREVAAIIVTAWAYAEYVKLQRRRRSWFGRDTDGDFYFGPGY